MSKAWVIAVESSDFDGKPYKTRYWGDGHETFLWESETAATDYMDSIDDGCFHDHSAVIDDVMVIEVEMDDIPGPKIFPWWFSWGDNPRKSGGPILYTTREGYDTELIYDREES